MVLVSGCCVVMRRAEWAMYMVQVLLSFVVGIFFVVVVFAVIAVLAGARGVIIRIKLLYYQYIFIFCIYHLDFIIINATLAAYQRYKYKE